MYSATRDDVKKLVQQIETLAKEVVTQLDDGKNFLLLANELVRNTNTMVFAIGEVYALEQSALNQSSSGNKKKATVVSTSGSKNFHNVRDSRGRFVSKVSLQNNVVV